jgi:hypothetical protein
MYMYLCFDRSSAEPHPGAGQSAPDYAACLCGPTTRGLARFHPEKQPLQQTPLVVQLVGQAPPRFLRESASTALAFQT